MKKKIDVNELDKKMQKDGWKFLGAILNYEKAWKKQASVYEKDGKYVVSGIDFTGETELHEPISKNEAEKGLDESLKEIRRLMFGISK
jgi:hypothetical protein